MLRRVVLALVGVLVLGVAGAGSASALTVHAFSLSFGSPGAGAGELSAPAGVAVDDATHDVFVADTGNRRVDVFSAEGVFLLAFGANVGGAGVDTCTSLSGCVAGTSGAAPGEFQAPAFVAVDNDPASLSFNDVYVADTGTGLVQKFTSAGGLVSGWGDHTPAADGQLAGGAAEEGPFVKGGASLAGIAVDSLGNLWVYNTNAEMFEFDQAAGFVQNWGTPEGARQHGIAVDGAGNLYLVNLYGAVEELTSSGTRLALLTPEIGFRPGEPTGLAVDRVSGETFVDVGSSIERVVGSSNVFGSAQLGDGAGAGLAVDAGNSTVYAADTTAGQVDEFISEAELVVSTTAASNMTATTATVNGTVEPAGSPITDCHFEYGTSTAYGQSAPCEESVGGGTGEVPVHANLKGLLPGTIYHYRLVATSEKDGTREGQDVEVLTLSVPVISEPATLNQTASSADITATINPEGVEKTEYRFEWGTSTAYGTKVPVPDASIATGTGGVQVSQHISPLSANTTYHWRVVAHDANGESASPDQTFVYTTTGGGGLPDGRQYELVTPMQKNGALVGGGLGTLPISIAENGQRLIAPSLQCFADATSCVPDRQKEGPLFGFTRTAAGWVTSSLTPSAAASEGNSVWLDNATVGSALYSALIPPQTSDESYGHEELYGQENNGTVRDIGRTSETINLIYETGTITSIGTASATSDLSRVVYSTLGPEWPSFDKSLPGHGSLYEFSGSEGGEPELVGVSGSVGSRDLIGVCGTSLGVNDSTAAERFNPLAGDGRTVYFTVAPCETGTGANTDVRVPAQELYVRIDRSRTELISGRAAVGCGTSCRASGPRDANFDGASADGSRVFFTSTQQLTDSASEDSNSSDSAVGGCAETTAGTGGCNLYESECPARCEDPSQRELIDVSAGDPRPRVQGVLALAPDGSHVYFVAQGVMTTTPNQQGEVAQSGEPNLYVYERAGHGAEGQVAFVTRLAASDSEEWQDNLAVANVTPEGRFLVFRSHRALTADDTRAEGPAQVYRYDAQTRTLARISIGEDGFNDNGNNGIGDASISDADLSYGDVTGPARADPTMSNDGAYVFFESPVALTPGALDDVSIAGTGTNSALAQNVYEYHDGQVSLISDGKDVSPDSNVNANAGELLGSDGSGANVFFATYDRLVPQDNDSERDIYDAHICSASEPCLPSAATGPVPCAEGACQGAFGGQAATASPGSLSFSGAGNVAAAPSVKLKVAVRVRVVGLARALRACRVKHGKSRRRACEVQARKHYASASKTMKQARANRGMK